MKHLVRGVGAAAALLAAVAGNAWAFGPYSNTQICGGNMFTTCATLTTSYDAGTNTLTIEIANTSSNGDFFTAFGVNNLPAGVNMSGGTPDPAFATWTGGSQNDLGGGGEYQGWGTNGQPSTFGIGNDGNKYTFTIVFDGAVDPNTLGFGLHSQAGPNGCSTKLFIDANGGYNNEVSPDCATTTVPEPVTMTLLATGLAGMGGAGLVRRRNKKA